MINNSERTKEITCQNCLKNFTVIIKGKGTGYRKYCDSCQKDQSRYKEYHKNYYKKSNKEKNKRDAKAALLKRIEKGVCVVCTLPTLPHNKYLCEKHWYIQIASDNLGSQSVKNGELLKNKMEKQNYKCPYTNETLIPGLNCHIDHIKPKSRFPELIYDINNLEWVLDKVNMAKRNMTKGEFIEFCKLIANNN